MHRWLLTALEVLPIGLVTLAGLGCGEGAAERDGATDAIGDRDAGDRDAATPDAPPFDSGDVPLEPCGATLAELIATAAENAPAAGSQDYQVPSAVRRIALADSVAAAGSANALAYQRADDAGYELCAVSSGEVLVWRPRAIGDGDAWIAYRPAPTHRLIVEAPHPRYDSDTGSEAALVFESLGARALVVSGTHRCANVGEASGCDGTTSACGTSAPYPVSDMAHTTDSFFQAAHVALAQRHDDHWIVNLHGMAAAGVHISNGTTHATDADAPVAQVAEALAAALPAQDIQSCNDYPGADTTTELCGTNNVQGRHVNGSPDPCTTPAAAAAGRFLHVEQSRAVRDQPDQVAAALAAVAP